MAHHPIHYRGEKQNTFLTKYDPQADSDFLSTACGLLNGRYAQVSEESKVTCKRCLKSIEAWKNKIFKAVYENFHRRKI